MRVHGPGAATGVRADMGLGENVSVSDVRGDEGGEKAKEQRATGNP